jgi:hypothetical protein
MKTIVLLFVLGLAACGETGRCAISYEFYANGGKTQQISYTNGSGGTSSHSTEDTWKDSIRANEGELVYLSGSCDTGDDYDAKCSVEVIVKERGTQVARSTDADAGYASASAAHVVECAN